MKKTLQDGANLKNKKNNEGFYNMESTLSHYFGYDTYRPGQKEIISKVLNHQNVLGVLPTGGGKSICYQVPGLMLGLSLIHI